MRGLLAGLLGLGLMAGSARAETTYVHAGALLDRPGQAPRGASTLILKDGKICCSTGHRSCQAHKDQ